MTLAYEVDGSTWTQMYYDGKSVEWVVERPFINNSLTTLANFGTVNWMHAQVQDAAGNWSVFGDNMGTELVMQSEAGVPLASSDDLSALDAFTLRFHNCG